MAKAVVLFFIVAVLTNAHGVLPEAAPAKLPFCNENSDCLPLCKQCAICACCDGVCVRGCTRKALEIDLASKAKVMKNCLPV